MSMDRLPEIMFYELIDLFPNLVLAYFAFRHDLRVSKWGLGIMTGLLYIMLVLSRMIAFGNLPVATVVTVVWIALYLTFYRISIQAEHTKLLYVLLIILNYNSFISIIFSYFSYYKLPGIPLRPYSFQATLIFIGVLAVSYPFVFLLMTKKVAPLIQHSENNKIWRFLWLIPATFCLSYYYNLYSNGGIIQFSASLNNVLFAAAFHAGAFFVTYIVVLLVEDSNSNLRLKAENYQLNLQFMQYENLKNRMEDSRRARHDLRQNMAVIQSYLKDGNKEGLAEYIRQYNEVLPNNSAIIYCNNYALNAMIVYYEEMAKKHHIHFHARIQYTPNSTITDPDMAVLLGNLLENAVEACARITNDGAFITLCIQNNANHVVITLDNSYNGIIRKINNSFLSTKTNRVGMGITSIEKITGKYHGIAKFDYDDQIFRSSILLYP